MVEAEESKPKLTVGEHVHMVYIPPIHPLKSPVTWTSIKTNPSLTTQSRYTRPQCSRMSTTEEDDYGDDLVYDSELDEKLRAAESVVPDIEDAVGPPPQALAPFDEFRRRGFLSVSDLVGTVWCEVQFD